MGTPMGIIQDNGYYSILSPGSIISTPGSSISNNSKLKSDPTLIKPNNIFALEQNVMQNVNAFQQKYARFMRCNNPNSADSVTNPTCDLTSFDSTSSLNTSYKNVMDSISTLSSALDNIGQTPGSSAITPKHHDEIKNDITGISDMGHENTYDQIQQLRKKLDERLALLYNEKKAGPESSALKLDSAIYANTLWTILATCLIYYIIVEL